PSVSLVIRFGRRPAKSRGEVVGVVDDLGDVVAGCVLGLDLEGDGAVGGGWVGDGVVSGVDAIALAGDRGGGLPGGAAVGAGPQLQAGYRRAGGVLVVGADIDLVAGECGDSAVQVEVRVVPQVDQRYRLAGPGGTEDGVSATVPGW